MRFRPRHYILIAIIIALAAYNLMRVHLARERQASSASSAPATAPVGPVPQSPAWQAFDKASALRDAPDNVFLPAFHEFESQLDSAASADKPDLDGCQTWLLFYRQGARHATSQDSWRQRSTQHITTCVQQHRDLSR